METINEMNETGKRKIPDNAPLDFISTRWNRHVFEDDGSINRHYYEMAALTELKNGIRSGDISVVGSRQHKDFEEYLVSNDEWHNSNTRLAVSLSFDDYISERQEALLNRINWVSNNIETLEGVNLEKGEIHVKRLDKDTPEEAKSFSLSLYSMFPRVKLTDLLLEVANWTKFDEQFTHASTGRPPKHNEKEIIMAALIAMGTNIGLSKMADATPGISYHQMANTAQWRMYDDAIIRAQASLVNFQHRLSLPNYWGDGSTSSSDGMRVQIGVSSLHAEHNPHYGSGKGATIYVLRLAHSIREGKVSASLIMGKLGSYARKNSLSMALREMGRIEKTIFILDYISSEALRRRIPKGLNKGEAANALARALFFGKRGEFYERDIRDQLQRASTLNILINAVSVWNTIYLSQAIEYLRKTGSLKEELLSHVSPLSWEHINFYGEYNFDFKNVPSLDRLRPLNTSNNEK